MNCTGWKKKNTPNTVPYMEEKPSRRRGEFLMGQQRWSPIRQKPGSVSSTASRREGKYEHLKELSVFFFSFIFCTGNWGGGGVSLSSSGVQRAKSSQLLQPAFTLRMNHSLGSSRHTGTA